MGTYTKNLNLYNTNMDEDGNDTFDFQRDLNDNNDKLDTAFGKLSDSINELVTNFEQKADTSSLSTVATTGKYSDLTGTPTIDTALSSSSANAVQNKVVTTALDTKRTNLYARCAIGVASSSYPYVQLANYYDATSGNNNINALFIVDVTGTTIANSGSGIVKLWGRWSTSSLSALKFELLSYNGGDSAKALIQNLVACYSYTANNSTGFKLEIWEKTTTSYQTIYLRPISMCNNDYGKIDIINGTHWTFNNKYGDATAIGSASITSGYTQVAMTDKTTASYVTDTYTQDNSWYRIYSDGWCEQGGYATSGTTSVTFLKTFSSAPLYFSYSTTPFSGGYQYIEFDSFPSATGYTRKYPSQPTKWEAKGYVAI